MLAMGRKGGPRDMRPVDPLSGRVITEGKQNTVAEEEVDKDENSSS